MKVTVQMLPSPIPSLPLPSPHTPHRHGEVSGSRALGVCVCTEEQAIGSEKGNRRAALCVALCTRRHCSGLHTV